MPSEQTIRALQSPLDQVVGSQPLTRKERIANSHQEMQWAKEYELSEHVGFIGGSNKSIAQRFLESEFAQNVREDGLTSATSEEIQTTAANALGLSLGVAGDAVKLAYSMMQYAPKGVSDRPLPDLDNVFEPFTSESIAQMVGGDPDHYSWLPAALGTPGVGPQEIKFAALMIGRRGAPSIRPLDDAVQRGMLEKDPFDEDIARETGWFRDQDGEVYTLLDTRGASFKWKDKVLNDPKIGMYISGELDVGGAPLLGVAKGRLDEMVDFPELFEAYPKLRALPVHIKYRVTPDGAIEVRPPSKGESIGSLLDDRKGNLKSVRINSADATYPFEDTFWHEIEHAIQNLEGFARGGSAKVLEEPIKTIKKMADTKDAFEFIDKGEDTIDDLAQALQEAGWDEDRIALTLNNKDVNAYMGASYDADSLTMHLLSSEVNDTLAGASDKVNYVLTYLDPSDRERAMEILRKNAWSVRNLMPGLFSRAYKNLLGESMARFAGETRAMSIDEILDEGLLDYRTRGDVTKGFGEVSPRTNPEDVRVIGEDTREATLGDFQLSEGSQ